jgi:hypothetical protein
MIVSYDIDGVLAEQPPPSSKKWGHMKGWERNERKEFLLDWYCNAKQLLIPSEEKFHAISARKGETPIFAATQSWLAKYYGDRVISFHLLQDSRTIENVVKFKTQTVLNLGVQRHYEDNRKVLSGMRKKLPLEVELYFWEFGMEQPIPFN